MIFILLAKAESIPPENFGISLQEAKMEALNLSLFCCLKLALEDIESPPVICFNLRLLITIVLSNSDVRRIFFPRMLSNQFVQAFAS